MRTLALAALLVASSLFAQQPAANVQAVAPGQVAGRVFCADTGQPGRFAGVQLIAEQLSKEPILDPASLGKDPNFEKLLAKAMSAAMKGSNLATITTLDGAFSLDKVPPGTYYVIAQLPGYRSPLSQFSPLERMKADDATVKAVESQAEKIVVQSNQSAHVDIRLERGSTVSGSVRYDDGSPAPGVTPVLLALGKDGKWKQMGMTSTLPASTDDRGHYRLYGIPAGSYAVQAALPTSQALVGLGGGSVSMHMNLGDALTIYSGGAFREKDLKPIELGTGQDLDGIDIVFPISGLHAISGTVVAKSDNHPVDAGSVELKDPETKAMVRMTMIEQDGSFHLNYVPDGQYVLQVSSAADTEQKPGDDSSGQFARLLHAKTIKSYGTADLPINLKSDSTSLVLQVPDLPAKPGGKPEQAGDSGIN
jgi:hypothetical protein